MILGNIFIHRQLRSLQFRSSTLTSIEGARYQSIISNDVFTLESLWLVVVLLPIFARHLNSGALPFPTFQIRSIDDQHASITWYLRFTRCRKEGSRTYWRGSQTSVLWTSLCFFFSLVRCISRQKQTHQRCPKRSKGRDRSVSRGTWTPLQRPRTTGSFWKLMISLWTFTVAFLFFAWWISNWAIERKWLKSRTRTRKFR